MWAGESFTIAQEIHLQSWHQLRTILIPTKFYWNKHNVSMTTIVEVINWCLRRSKRFWLFLQFEFGTYRVFCVQIVLYFSLLKTVSRFPMLLVKSLTELLLKCQYLHQTCKSKHRVYSLLCTMASKIMIRVPKWNILRSVQNISELRNRLQYNFAKTNTRPHENLFLNIGS